MKHIIRYVLNHLPRKIIQRFVHLLTPVAGIFYVGRGVKCPVCGARYRKFLPYGYGQMRDNAMCPRCMSLERHRLMWLYLKNETNILVSRPRVLHVAPERCFIKRFEHLWGQNYVTADLESPLAKVKMDIQAMPFPDESFDVVLCNHILEHVEDDRKAMRELLRVLKHGGWGIVCSPINYLRQTTYEDSSIVTPEARREAFRQPDHLRDYGTDYADRLRAEGFEVEVVDYAHRLSEQQRKMFAVECDSLVLVRRK